MRASGIGTTFFLSATEIDRASEKVFSFLTELGLNSKEIARIRLSVEEILLTWQDRYGEKTSADLSCYSKLGQPVIRMALTGDAFDPLNNTEELGEWGKSLLARLETQPIYSYSRGSNIVTFKVLKERKNPFLLLLIALGAAIAVGLLGTLIPENIKLAITDQWMTPLCNSYLSILSFCGIPLIFLSVVLGIIGVGDVNTFERIGTKMIKHNFLAVIAATLFTGLIAFPAFDFAFGENSLNIMLKDILEMILGWLPGNLVQPFIDCNAMQLVIMGVVFGIGLLKLDPLAKSLANVLDDLNNLLLLVSVWLTKLIPIFVFITFVRSFWMGDLSEILPAWQSWVVTTGLQCIVFLIMAIQICSKYKVKLKNLLKKISATFLIALGTNSCTASISENYACCAGKLGIDSKIFSFGIPIGTSTFKPAAAIRMMVLVYYMANLYQVKVSLMWFVTAFLITVVLSVAVPAIPGGVLMFCPMLFSQLGLPAAAVAPMLATDIFFDAVCTAFNQVFVQLVLVQEAGTMNMLNVDVLRS